MSYKSSFFTENQCFQTHCLYSAIILWIWKAARKGHILSQRDGSDGACRRFRFRNRFAREGQINVQKNDPNRSQPGTAQLRKVDKNSTGNLWKVDKQSTETRRKVDGQLTKLRKVYGQTTKCLRRVYGHLKITQNRKDQKDDQGFHEKPSKSVHCFCCLTVQHIYVLDSHFSQL